MHLSTSRTKLDNRCLVSLLQLHQNCFVVPKILMQFVLVDMLVFHLKKAVFYLEQILSLEFEP